MILDLSKLSAKQDAFLRDEHRHVAYGGARGGGKSWAVRTKAKILGVNYPGIKMLIVRRTLDELRNNHVKFLVPELSGVAQYNQSTKEFRFRNGSTLTLGYCDNDNDLMHFQGAEYDVVFLDEAGQLLEDWIKKINACVRGANSFPKRTYYTLNPGGPSHGYFKRLFVDRHFEGTEKPENYSFIQALATDNLALMEMQPDYLDELKNLPPKIREAWLYGRWDIYEGQFFEDFRTDPDVSRCVESGITPDEARLQHRFTHVIPAFDINAGSCRAWKVYRSYDFGYAKPFSCAWWTVDFEGTIYRIMELYGCTDTPNEGVKWSPDEQFRRIHEIETTHPWLKNRSIIGVADPAIWDASRGESIAATADKYGVHFLPGDNKRIPGWMQCHYRLQFDEQGYARMYVFDNCRAFIRTVPLLMYSQTHVEDLDTSMEDHVADEWRYFCMQPALQVKPMMPVKQRTILSDPLDQFGG